MLVVYYSSSSEYTHKFARKLRHPTQRLPLLTRDEMPEIDEPYVLITPTYGAGPNRGSVPKQVKKFLATAKANRTNLLGVIGAGNTNFGQNYCRAADLVAAKCNVPVLYRFELLGTPEDVAKVDEGLEELCQRQQRSEI
ncbi:class Ib ribonucleoside-diphosphate reductase assembly flavoprotein NrdI [Brevibacterium sp. 50QC2O2]|jgi:protein involved in ribonucleotide reduction|uniref:class Ib ribonucleoside-diphosphate reductase assembly flavoprotein NrdI n=1 Tax=Brevibacterium TaxID=1696 RepID=UPI00211D0E49|nr:MULTISPECIES: class Ib ribonucleoside-diphosphate reductase assembly flavoprotein NrdI [unclassified Brevibacterium]MCQ9367294.1 class Ib ribonucleoside-diphosphate reductase assembly flavoprotein NrdI [Brevibacterium sp. 91QC2O2]MCQ9384675.1 class Ib ribonucleoside-diphosphate reductase assembly flavoprotein NrdI [Brevibacterium sp. 68QC2CO]MCQ9389261.1 class Ib ribonucleoside-diphosphate reductase assembly flavoprotein NrdI [Brevibacterium sp. 50QC2O2]